MRLKADDKVTAPRGAQVALPIGSLVRYYDDGWRTGHLEQIKLGLAQIRPIAAYKAHGRTRCVRIPIGDVELASNS